LSGTFLSKITSLRQAARRLQSPAADTVTLVLLPEPPTQDEIETVLIATEGITRHAGRTGVFKKWLNDKRLGPIMYVCCLAATQVGPHYSLALGLFLAKDEPFRQGIEHYLDIPSLLRCTCEKYRSWIT
jgi:hypothetical protein